MRRFIDFVIGAFVGGFARLIAAAALIAMGLVPENIIALVTEPPAWLIVWQTRTAFVVVAVLLIMWTFYAQSRIEIQIPERLKIKRFLTFIDIVRSLFRTNIGLRPNEIRHRLLRSMWMGDFETRSGRGRLTLASPNGVRTVNGVLIPIRAEEPQDLGQDLNADASPSRTVFNRHMMLQTLQDEQSVVAIYPDLPRLLREQSSWEELRHRVDFALLQNIPPTMYSPHWQSAYFDNLAMSRRDFVRWFRRLRNGRYDAEHQWP